MSKETKKSALDQMREAAEAQQAEKARLIEWSREQAERNWEKSRKYFADKAQAKAQAEDAKPGDEDPKQKADNKSEQGKAEGKTNGKADEKPQDKDKDGAKEPKEATSPEVVKASRKQALLDELNRQYAVIHNVGVHCVIADLFPSPDDKAPVQLISFEDFKKRYSVCVRRRKQATSGGGLVAHPSETAAISRSHVGA